MSRSTEEHEFHKKRLLAFYNKHNPDKVDQIDATLEKYVGREDTLIDDLEIKYGENPTKVWLTEFYLEYNPAKVEEIDATLVKYQGREEELFRKLEKKYGGSSSGGNSSGNSSNSKSSDDKATTTKEETTNNKKVLEDFYAKYNPEKFDTVESTLAKYEGREEELWSKLEKKYGESPVGGSAVASAVAAAEDEEEPAPVTAAAAVSRSSSISSVVVTTTTDYSSGAKNKEFTKKRLMACYTKHNPKRMDTIDAVLSKHDGNEEEMLQKLETKYGDNPTTVWLTAFYTKYNPDRVPTVDRMMDKYAGDEETMFTKLVTKYNDPLVCVVDEAEATPVQQPEEKKEAALSKEKSLSAVVPTTTTDYSSGSTNKEFNKKRLIEYYTRYNPTKLDSIDRVLSKHAGKEEDMLQKLETKYGENPTSVWLFAFYSKYNPDRVPTVDRMMEKYVGDEEKMFTKLITKYNDPPVCVDDDEGEEEEAPEEKEEEEEQTVSQEAVVVVVESAAVAAAADPDGEFNQKRLSAFYRKHNSDKINTVETTLEKFAGKEDVMFAKLEKKYGENPTKPWLEEFYRDHNPEKVDQADATLEKYAGREEVLYYKLTKKYAAAAAAEKEAEATRALARQESERMKIEAEAMQEQLQKEEREIAILEQEAAGAVAIGTASLRTIEAYEEEEKKEEESVVVADKAIAVAAEPPAQPIPVLPLGDPVLQAKMLSEFNAYIMSGSKKLQDEYVEDCGTEWMDDDRLLGQYTKLIQWMAATKRKRINRSLSPRDQITHELAFEDDVCKVTPALYKHISLHDDLAEEHHADDFDNTIVADNDDVGSSIMDTIPAAVSHEDWDKYYKQ